MKRNIIIGSIIAAVVLIGGISAASNGSRPEAVQTINTAVPVKEVKKVTPTCDGTSVTKGCALYGVNYSTYIYHPATPEKSHDETVTTYEQKVTSYCTQCNDGTYSPSCATGRGACSHHDGVAQWNAPRYSTVAVKGTKKVIDTLAQEAYYEKVVGN